MATLNFSTKQVAENSTGAIVTLSCDGATRYELQAFPETLAIFTIVGDQIVVKDGVTLNYETQNTYSFGVVARDASGSVVGSYRFSDADPFKVLDVNEAPTAITKDGGVVSESASVGDAVAT
jgi:hypothetical protein